MTISEVYTRYSIPINLQEHMLRVGAVGFLVCDYLAEITIDKDRVVAMLLLHDMGNILKFKFERLELFAPEDQGRVDDMRRIQKEFRLKYGETPDQATLAIMREIGVDEATRDLCHKAHGERLEAIVASDDWEEKVGFYCDMRVGPFGVISIEDRFADLRVRYSQHDSRLQEQLLLAQTLEAQLQERSSTDIRAIDDDVVEPVVVQLQSKSIG